VVNELEALSRGVIVSAASHHVSDDGLISSLWTAVVIKDGFLALARLSRLAFGRNDSRYAKLQLHSKRVPRVVMIQRNRQVSCEDLVALWVRPHNQITKNLVKQDGSSLKWRGDKFCPAPTVRDWCAVPIKYIKKAAVVDPFSGQLIRIGVEEARRAHQLWDSSPILPDHGDIVRLRPNWSGRRSRSDGLVQRFVSEWHRRRAAGEHEEQYWP